MARLVGGEWLMQQIDNDIVLFHEGDEEEIVRYNWLDPDATTKAQKTIHDSTLLTDEEKCFAHFWSGYFYSWATDTDRMPQL
jgi:hypothetical protein